VPQAAYGIGAAPLEVAHLPDVPACTRPASSACLPSGGLTKAEGVLTRDKRLLQGKRFLDESKRAGFVP